MLSVLYFSNRKRERTVEKGINVKKGYKWHRIYLKIFKSQAAETILSHFEDGY